MTEESGSVPPVAHGDRWPIAVASLIVGGAFFQTRVRTPRISRSAISKGEPGRVSSALASASEIAGKFFAAAT